MNERAETTDPTPGRIVVGIDDSAESMTALVVGSCGQGGFVGALLGSVSQHVVAQATCPVVIVPDPSRPRGITA